MEMDRRRFFAIHKLMCEAARNLSRPKNHDYATGGGVDDALANFRECEAQGIASVEAGVFIRFQDKYKRICTYLRLLKEGLSLAVKSESLFDAVLDAMNYLIIFAVALDDKGRIDVNNEILKAGLLTVDEIRRISDEEDNRASGSGNDESGNDSDGDAPLGAVS